MLYIDRDSLVVGMFVFMFLVLCPSPSPAYAQTLKLPADYKLLEVPTRDAPEDCFMTPYDIDIVWIFIDRKERVQKLTLARSIRFYGFSRPSYVTVALPVSEYRRVQIARKFGRLILGRTFSAGLKGRVSIEMSLPKALRSIGTPESLKAAKQLENQEL